MASSRRARSAPAPFRVTLSARVVEAFLGFWSPLPDEFADPDVARDFLRHLAPSYGPTIVRAKVTGGTMSERVAVAGDWFCDDAGGENVGLCPAADWSYSEESAEWTSDRPLLDAWEECDDARWMLHAAGRLGVDWRLLALAACDCARWSMPRDGAGVSPGTLRVLGVTEAWARGEATVEEVVASAEAPGPVDHAATYAAWVAHAGTDWHAGDLAARSADAAMRAPSPPDGWTFAGAVRERIPTITVLRSATSRQGGDPQGR